MTIPEAFDLTKVLFQNITGNNIILLLIFGALLTLIVKMTHVSCFKDSLIAKNKGGKFWIFIFSVKLGLSMFELIVNIIIWTIK